MIQNRQCSLKQCFSSTALKRDMAYDGPGKTTVDILNQDHAETKLMVDGFSQYGFILNNGSRVIGPMAILPDAVLQWKIDDPFNIHPDAFVLFELLHPKP